MPTVNDSPEQRARFLTNDQLSKGTNELYSKPKRKKAPIFFGVLIAVLLFGGFVFYKDKLLSVTKTVLSPIITGDDGRMILRGPMLQNPLNGELVKAEEAEVWKDARPIGVMINNHLSSRPQSGLIDADLVYEIVAEGGITRYLAFFLSKLPEKIGTVRSTREYYLVLVKELGDAMLMHIGWSPQALVAIESWPVRSLGRGGAQFWRDQARIDAGIPIEHTAYVNGPELRELGNELGWEGKREIEAWKFKEDGPVDTTQQCLVAECDKPLVIDFWFSGDYTGAFKYDRATNTYLRYSGYDANNQLDPLIDPEAKKQVSAKNVVVQFVTELSIAGDDKSRLDYQLVGSGQAIVFLDGKAVKAIWKKDGRDNRTKFFDLEGQEILFNRGKIWVSIVPDRNINQVSF